MMPCFDDFLPNSGWGDYFFLPFDLLLLRLIMCAGWVVFFFFFLGNFIYAWAWDLGSTISILHLLWPGIIWPLS